MESSKPGIGTVLWHMVGKRRNGIIEWYASPKCIEKVDAHMYHFGDGCGGSWNSIGRNDFLSREECLDHFMKTHDSLIQEIGMDDESPEGCYDLPRTDWQGYKVYRFDGVTVTDVYVGSLNRMTRVTASIQWRSPDPDFPELGEYATLSDIHDRYKAITGASTSPILTVFENGPTTCNIFQCGNYKDGKWVKLGSVMGYA